MNEIELQLLRAEVAWYREKVDTVASSLDQLGRKAKAQGSTQAAWAFENAAKLVQRINEKPIAGSPS